MAEFPPSPKIKIAFAPTSHFRPGDRKICFIRLNGKMVCDTFVFISEENKFFNNGLGVSIKEVDGFFELSWFEDEFAGIDYEKSTHGNAQMIDGPSRGVVPDERAAQRAGG